MNDEINTSEELRQLEERLRGKILAGMDTSSTGRVFDRVRDHVQAFPKGRSRFGGGWNQRLLAIAPFLVPAAAAAAIALAVISTQPQKAILPVPAGSPSTHASPLVSPSPEASLSPQASPRAAVPVLVETTSPTTGQGPVTVHWVTLGGVELASQNLPATEALIGPGGSRLLVYRSDGHVLDLHMDGSTEDIGSGMPKSTSPGQTSVPVRALASPDGSQWIWSEIVSTSPDGTTHSRIWLSGAGQTPRVVAEATEMGHALQPRRWTLANPLISHGAIGVGGYLLFDYSFGATDQLDLATGKQTPVGPADATIVDVAGNGAIAYIQNHTVVQNGPGLRGLSANLPASGQAGGLLFDPSSSHLVFATSPALGPQGEQFETDILDLNTGARTKLGPPGVRPEGWTPDGRLIVVRPSGAAGGPAGTFLVSLSGSVTQLSGATQYYGLTQ